MITEDYVSFETAKLLKEKGFDEPCYQCYVLFDKFVETSYYEFAIDSKLIKFDRLYADEQPLINSKGFRHLIDKRDKSRVFAAPTLQMAMKWLREIHNIKVNVFYNNSNYAIEYFEQNTQTGVDESVFIGDGYDVYEQACEVAIKYCLENLI